MKHCAKCKTEKPRAAFYADKSKADGLSSYCKPCRIEASCQRQKDDPEARRQYMQRYYEENTARWQEYGRKRYADHRGDVLAAVAAWQCANRDKVNGYAKAYREANPSKRAALIAKYRAAQAQRTPPWLDQAYLAEIEGVYHFAKVMERIAGEKYHVDHIEPLQGVEVSGLHVPWNLRAIPAREHWSKGNRRVEA